VVKVEFIKRLVVMVARVAEQVVMETLQQVVQELAEKVIMVVLLGLVLSTMAVEAVAVKVQ
jgi:hypothetical protein